MRLAMAAGLGWLLLGAAACGIEEGALGGIDAGMDRDGGRHDGGDPDAGPDGGGSCGMSCDDGNPCTDDACDPGGGCEHTPHGRPCDDGLFCNGADLCADGECAVHEGDPCAGMGACDEEANACAGCPECPDPIVGAWGACGGFSDTCDERGEQSREVTGYTCTSGACEPRTTSETRSCTRDTDGHACDDGDECTMADRCSDGACEPGTRRTCNDGNACTDDRCDSATGVCIFVASSASCDDGDACAGDRCNGGTCQSACDDRDPCTTDSCHPTMGCRNMPIGGCTSG